MAVKRNDAGAAPGVLNLRPVVNGLVYRSSQPFGWDAAQTRRFLEDLGVSAVVDLRSEREAALVPWLLDVARAGTRAGAGRPVPEVIAAPLDPSQGMPAGTRPLETPRDLAELYLSWAEASSGLVVRGLVPIAEGRTTLLHCAAGKDRTGLMAAVVHLSAGTPQERIVADYAHTAQELPAVLRALDELYRRARPEEPDRGYVSDNPPVLYTSPAAAMEAFLEMFAARFGTVDAYLRGAGMPAPLLAELKARLRGKRGGPEG